MSKITTTKPYEISTADRAVGLIVVSVILLLFSFIILQYQEIEIGEGTIKYHTSTSHAYGITSGGDVRLSGITIGKIEEIALSTNGDVRIDLSIQDEYHNYITEGSHLEVDSSIGLGSIIGGTGLRFIPDPTSTNPIPSESEIQLIPPVNLAEVISASELKKISDDIKQLLHNINVITASVADNQENISKSMHNMAAITEELREAVRAVPKMTDTINSGFSAWGEAGKTVSDVIDKSKDDFQGTITKTHLATDKLNATLIDFQKFVNDSNQLIEKLDLSASRLPGVLSEGQTLIRDVSKVTDSLNNHWLIGGGGKDAGSALPGLHPTDNTLYEQ